MAKLGAGGIRVQCLLPETKNEERESNVDALGERKRLRQQQSVLIIGKIWPEYGSTAAGVRTWQLVEAFLRMDFRVSFCTPAARGPYADELEALGVATWQCLPNRSAEFNDILLQSCPHVCVFDRFTTEEAFSFRVKDSHPHTLRVLDTQDLHFLRSARMAVIKSGGSISEAIQTRPDATSPDALRELSAIYRSDLTLVCSRFELDLLKVGYGVPSSKVAMASFYYPPPDPSLLASISRTMSPKPSDDAVPTGKLSGSRQVSGKTLEVPGGAEPGKESGHGERQVAIDEADRCRSSESGGVSGKGEAWGWEDRCHFVTVGSFKHAPNVDSVRWLAKEIWPKIRERLPTAECHVYGSYPLKADLALSNPAVGFFVKGHVASLDLLRKYRLCLAPLRFGAGIKGKIIDSWRFGLPVCTTPVGAEGLRVPGGRGSSADVAGPSDDVAVWGDEVAWGGWGRAVDGDEFVDDAVRLYTDQSLWENAQAKGVALLRELFDRSKNEAALERTMADAIEQMEQRRSFDLVGAMLWYHTARSTEFFSRWIELKEAVKPSTF